MFNLHCISNLKSSWILCGIFIIFWHVLLLYVHRILLKRNSSYNVLYSETTEINSIFSFSIYSDRKAVNYSIGLNPIKWIQSRWIMLLYIDCFWWLLMLLIEVITLSLVIFCSKLNTAFLLFSPRVIHHHRQEIPIYEESYPSAEHLNLSVQNELTLTLLRNLIKTCTNPIKAPFLR